MLKLKETAETKLNQADRQIDGSNAYTTATKTKTVKRIPRLLATVHGV